MEIKERLENLLFSLKKAGFDRRTIEKDLDYAEYYIDQILSKGGNKKFLIRLEKYNIEKSNPLNKKNDQDYTSDTVSLLAKAIIIHAETINSQQDVIRRYIEKEPDIGEVPKNASPSPQMKTIKPQK